MIGFWVAIGGGIGALARFAIGGWVTTWAYAGFPWPTFIINVSGSCLLAIVYRLMPTTTSSPRLRGFLTVGLCGGFTTFSTFDLETFSLIDQNRFALAAAYSLGSAAACIAGVFLGLRIGGRLGRRSEVP